MTQPDPSHFDGPRPERRSSRPPARGQHPSISGAKSRPVASAQPQDFLGLEMEVHRARAQAEIMPQQAHLFVPPPAAPDTRVSTNTTLIPRSSVFARTPAQEPLVPLPPLPAPRMPAPPAQRLPAPPATSTAPHQQQPFAGVRWPEEPVRTNSWLLALDDARSGRAGVGPVVHDPLRQAQGVAAPAQLDASFAEAPPVSSRTVPWLVRGLIAAAAASFLFVVGSTVLSPKLTDTSVKYVPPQVTSRILVENGAELSDPGPRGASTVAEAGLVPGRRNPTQRPLAQSPVRPVIPPAAPAAPVRDEQPPTFIEVVPPEFAPNLNPNNAPPPNPNGTNEQQSSASDSALPRWDAGMVNSTPLARGEAGPNADELAASPERQARVQSSLMRASRGAAPVEDANGDYTPPVSTASFPVSGGVNSAASPAAAAKVPGPAKQGVARAGGVWDGEAVPVDQIGAKMQILTPRVGRVRVTLASGDVKEGRLHAVGEGQLWLEVGRSFESIARANIERLEQIGGAAEVLAASSEKPAAKPAAPSSDKRVRVRTAGGLFYGKIVARDGDTLTLLTDEGARVTIEGGSIEAAPEHKTVVKHPAPPKPVTKPTPEQLPAAHGVEPGPDAEVPGVPPAPPGSR